MTTTYQIDIFFKQKGHSKPDSYRIYRKRPIGYKIASKLVQSHLETRSSKKVKPSTINVYAISSVNKQGEQNARSPR